jgi:methyl-accepting chemotaxis protein
VGQARWVYYPDRRARGRVPVGLQVKVAAGGLLALLAVSMGVAILLFVGLDQDQTHLNDRDLPYDSAINEAALNAKAVANDQRGFLLSGDLRYFEEANRRIGIARVAFKRALALADPGAQHQAVSAALTGFERWVEVVHGEFANFQQGNRHGAISASLEADRQLRGAYEQSLTTAHAMGTTSLEAKKSSVAAESTRSLRILLSCSLGGLAVGGAVAYWLVRSIAGPISGLTARLGLRS